MHRERPSRGPRPPSAGDRVHPFSGRVLPLGHAFRLMPRDSCPRLDMHRAVVLGGRHNMTGRGRGTGARLSALWCATILGGSVACEQAYADAFEVLRRDEPSAPLAYAQARGIMARRLAAAHGQRAVAVLVAPSTCFGRSRARRFPSRSLRPGRSPRRHKGSLSIRMR